MKSLHLTIAFSHKLMQCRECSGNAQIIVHGSTERGINSHIIK